MASLYPAQAMGIADRLGQLKRGAVASMVHLSDDLKVCATWIGGKQAFAA
jgi:N-acetylglucosamine-6-phosphate deacetylase